MHHASIRTADIHRAITFYQLLGFEMEEQFTAGITLACWMTGLTGRIELLQIPEPKATPDCFHDEHYTGYYHLSFDLTEVTDSLPDWLESLETRFAEAHENTPDGVTPLKILLPPTQQMIGTSVYEVAFVADADGLPLEFLRMMKHEQ
ncbi:VOC family protein [Oscillatoria sp. CS-180]|uniref:VOC family protein n=1 Tax=Oscillatoria sp. CS-180 TaxID=3021720 RepID=UPI00232AD5D4|nr:VOC family protein [Oscillatoria sp. CS-180]MDB9524493.1 VOC family protein [Oscillatoria sp. CS-180]